MRRKTAVIIAATLSIAAGCRLIAGYEDVTLAPADAAPPSSDGTSASDSGCLVAAPTRLFSTPNSIQALFVQGTTLYTTYTDSNSNSGLLSCDPTACATPSIAIAPTEAFDFSAPGPPVVLAVAGDDQGTTDEAGVPIPTGDGKILGFTSGTPSTISSTLGFPFALAVNGNDLYFTDDPYADSVTPTVGVATLRKCPVTGCASPAAWMTGFYETYQVAVGATRVFVLADTDESQTSTSIFSCSTQTPCGNKPTLTLSGTDDFQGAFATSGDTIFATSGNLNSILRVDPNSDGGSSSSFAADQTTPGSVIVDATYVYWTALTDTTNFIGDIRRKRIDGTGDIDRVVCGIDLSVALPLTGDATHLYVVVTDSSATSNSVVERVDKPQ